MRRSRIGFALLLAGAAGACTTEGFRADGGGCPRDEVCSEETPNGLRFAGSRFADDDLTIDRTVKAIAEGGSQSIEVLRNDVDLTPLTRFAAEMEGSGWAVIASSPPDVLIAADKEGIGYLRVADPDTDELYDKVDVKARRVERVELGPDPRELPGETESWALLTGEDRQVYVALYAPDDERLADESMALAAADGAGAQVAWDVLSIDRAEPGTGVVEVETGGGEIFELPVQWVEAIDAVAFDGDPEPSLPVGTTWWYCFRAYAGEATVYGAGWEFEAEGAIALDREAEPVASNCPMVVGTEAGVGLLRATAGDQVLEVAIEVIEADDRSAPRRPWTDLAVPPSRGARAAGVDGAP